MKWVRVCLFGICLIGVFGCARNVTPIVSFGTTAVVKVVLRGDVDVAGNKYYMVISSQEAYYIPSDPYPLIEPGEASSNPLYDKDDYYGNYYSTWNGYVVLDSAGEYLRVTGPFLVTQEVYTRDPIGSLVSPTQTLQFNLSLNDIFPGGIPTRIYFDFVTVGAATNILADHLPAPGKSTLTYIDTEISGTGLEDSDIAAGLDIISWKVLIQ